MLYLNGPTEYRGFFLHVNLHQHHGLVSVYWMDGWMDYLRFQVLFNRISVIAGRWADDNYLLCAMEPRSRLKSSAYLVGLQSGTARSVGQCLISKLRGSSLY